MSKIPFSDMYRILMRLQKEFGDVIKKYRFKGGQLGICMPKELTIDEFMKKCQSIDVSYREKEGGLPKRASVFSILDKLGFRKHPTKHSILIQYNDGELKKLETDENGVIKEKELKLVK